MTEPETPEPGIPGPHCSHDECGFGECGESGLVEYPCRKPGCPLCGGPAAGTPEQWASVASQVALMSPEDQARVAGYLDSYPLVRRGPDDNDGRLDRKD